MTKFSCAVDTATSLATVALFDGDELLVERERQAAPKTGHAESILALVEEVLATRNLSPRAIARWAVDIGPGSFTGARVGVGTIKGLAFATAAEVVGVTSFDALAFGTKEPTAVVLDAGKGEVYYRLEHDEPGHALLADVLGWVKARGMSLVGPGVSPRASGVGRVALSRSPDDVDRLEPFYVRPPDLTRPKI